MDGNTPETRKKRPNVFVHSFSFAMSMFVNLDAHSRPCALASHQKKRASAKCTERKIKCLLFYSCDFFLRRIRRPLPAADKERGEKKTRPPLSTRAGKERVAGTASHEKPKCATRKRQKEKDIEMPLADLQSRARETCPWWLRDATATRLWSLRSVNRSTLPADPTHRGTSLVCTAAPKKT